MSKFYIFATLYILLVIASALIFFWHVAVLGVVFILIIWWLLSQISKNIGV